MSRVLQLPPELSRIPSLWRGHAPPAVAHPSLPTGLPALDALLPGHGWPRGVLTELACAREGIAEVSLLLPALARLSQDDPRWITLVAPPRLPFAPALAAAGLDLARLIVVSAADVHDTLWATEQALRSGAASAVLAWPENTGVLNERMTRRLQLAAEAGGALAVSFVPPAFLQRASAAALRAHIHAEDGHTWLSIVKRRGGGWAPPVCLDPQAAAPSRPAAPRQHVLALAG